MVTSTIYSDSQSVIIDIGTVPATAPWLQRTTYLIDPSGHTTAVLAQTNSPTSGVTLAPVPYTAPTRTAVLPKATSSLHSGRLVTTSQSSVVQSSQPLVVQTSHTSAVQTQRPTTTEPSTAPSPTSATSRTPKVAVPVAAAVVGVVVAVAIAIALFYLRRRRRSDHLRKNGPLQTSQITAHAWPPADRTQSWEEFVRRTEEYCAKFDESPILSRERNGSGPGLKSNRVGHRPSTPEMRTQYELLQLNHQQSSHLRWNSSDTYVASPTTQLPPTRVPARAHLGQPTSILKRPAPRRVANMAEGTVEDRDESNSNIARAKKCVRFGVNQIREFGLSPFIGHGSDW